MRTFYPIVRCKLAKDAPMPAYAHEGDAGLDLCATEDVTLMPQEWQMVGSGVSMAIPKGFVGLVVPRSGLGCKGLVLKNGIGVIDSGYRGEIGLTLFNNNPMHWWDRFMDLFFPAPHRGKEPKGTIHVSKGDRVAQLLIVPVAQASLVHVDKLDETERQDGSFGSSGVQSRRL